MASGVFCQLEVNIPPVYTIHNKNKTSTRLSFNYVRQPTVEWIQVSSVKKASKGELNEIITKFVLNCVDRQNPKQKAFRLQDSSIHHTELCPRFQRVPERNEIVPKLHEYSSSSSECSASIVLFRLSFREYLVQKWRLALGLHLLHGALCYKSALCEDMLRYIIPSKCSWRY